MSLKIRPKGKSKQGSLCIDSSLASAQKKKIQRAPSPFPLPPLTREKKTRLFCLCDAHFRISRCRYSHVSSPPGTKARGRQLVLRQVAGACSGGGVRVSERSVVGRCRTRAMGRIRVIARTQVYQPSRRPLSVNTL